MDSSVVIAFVITSIIIIVLPGPAVMFIVTRSIDQGKAAGIISVLGLAAGTLILIISIGLGISAIILTSTVIISILKYLGAIYLVYLGICRILDKHDLTVFEGYEKTGLVKIFLQAIFINLLNPKTVLFFIAYLPQFTDASLGSYFEQILFFGVLFITLELFSDCIYSILAGNLREYFKRNKLFLVSHNYIAGIVYIGLGCFLVISDVK